MNTLVYFVAAQFMGGIMYFIGLGMACALAYWRQESESPRVRSISMVLLSVSVIFVLATATPTPWLAYLVWLCLLLASQFTWNSKRVRLLLVGFFVVCSANLILEEMVFFIKPTISLSEPTRLFVIGDSLGMGADLPGKNWPDLLGEQLGLPTTNRSFGGAKVGSALFNARAIGPGPVLVILEIGGNDLLSLGDDFEQGLDALLKETCQPEREVIMLELPLPPGHNSYGMAQRELAEEYGVQLIPKRFFAKVLAAPGATIDGLHFSNKGHELMATMLSGMFEK